VQAPTLAAISLAPSGGGVAVVARLLWRALQSDGGLDPRLLTLIRGESPLPTYLEKVRYALALAGVQAAGGTDWMLYSHLGLAKPLTSIPRRFRRPYAVFLHGIEVWRPLTAGELTILEQAECRLANSGYTAARVIDMHPTIGPVIPCPLALPPARIAITLDTADRPPIRPQPRSHDVLIVGRMLASERYKGHDELIAAWPRVVAAVPDARLVIAGDGDDRPRLEDKAARGPASRSIVFTGFVDDATRTALYEQAALFALPSRGEGFGLVYLEAMAHRLACIGSIHDAAGDVIVDGVTGRLVDQRDASALAGTIVDLLSADAVRARMGQAGRQRLLEQFTFERFADRLRHAIGRASAPAPVALAG
jgi:phosphatidylinositol alpha-1,6-mannosyltransferase